MDRQEAIATIRASWRDLYPHDKKNGIICPLCGSGSGPHGTGITGDSNHGKPNSLKCWGTCNFTGDVIDLIQQERHFDFNEAINYAANELGIIIDSNYSLERAKKDFSDNIATKEKTPVKTPTAPPTEAPADYTAYYEVCRREISTPAAVSYLTARGISLDTAISYGLGYDAKWISPTVIKNQRAKGSDWLPDPTERIIMPVTSNYYIARAISPDIKKDYAKMNETGGGKAGIFNSRALYDKEPVFITEGFFDALSIIEAGAAAVSLNSTHNADLLLKQLEQEPTQTTLIICQDNDPQGQKAVEVLKTGFRRLNVSYIVADINGAYKDPNEALTGNKEVFFAAIQNTIAQTAARPDNVSNYIDHLMQADIAQFKSETKTGFARLDELSGGLYPGLYVLAAISSLGKTTLALQMADNIAAAGNDVIFFSMEK